MVIILPKEFSGCWEKQRKLMFKKIFGMFGLLDEITVSIEAFFFLRECKKIDVDNQYNFKTIKDVKPLIYFDKYYKLMEKIVEDLKTPCDHEVESSFIDLTGITDEKELRRLRKKIHKSPK